jgi:S1-C subfamily serine protease
MLMQKEETQVSKVPVLTILSAVASIVLSLALWPTADLHDRITSAKSVSMLVDTPSGSGTGVTVKRENLHGDTRVFLWTAAHVICDSPLSVHAKIIFRESGQKAGSAEFPARLLFVDPATDLALFWVHVPAAFTHSAVFSTDPPAVGDPIFHVGNFLGENFDNSVSVGIVSQLNVLPSLPGWFWPSVDQADITVLPGGSGGGVFSATSGEVVGIMVAGLPGVAAYVPTRTVIEVATAAGLEWSVSGEYCPSDTGLTALADLWDALFSHPLLAPESAPFE